MPVTSLSRTVADLIGTLAPESAVALADAAFAMRAGNRLTREYDEHAHAAFVDDVRAHLPPGARGVRQARQVLDFADGRAESPGESVSRLYLRRLGFPPPCLQARIPAPSGRAYFCDFGFEALRTWGEFDGTSKYVDEQGGTDPVEIAGALLAEKRREDWIRGVTGWRVVRWGSADIASTEALSRRLQAFGLLPAPPRITAQFSL